jgi:HK97 family phage major capsid protein
MPTTQHDARGFRSFGEFLHKVHAAASQPRDPRLQDPGPARGSVDSEGGFLIPTDFVQALWARAYGQGQILQRVMRFPPPQGNDLRIPQIGDSNRSTGSRFGGLVAYWGDEAVQLAASKPAFAQARRELSKLTVLVRATNELVEDLSQLETYVTQFATLELTWQAENAIVNGPGVGRPQGLLLAPAKIVVSGETNQSASTIRGDNLAKMVGRMWGPSLPSACWLTSEASLLQLAKAATYDLGQEGSATDVHAERVPFNWDGTTESGGLPTLFGRPVITCEYCPPIGSEGDVVLTDLSQYGFTAKSRVAFSAHCEFLSAQSAFRFTMRCDGASLWGSTLAPANGGDTLSPIVTIACRS